MAGVEFRRAPTIRRHAAADPGRRPPAAEGRAAPARRVAAAAPTSVEALADELGVPLLRPRGELYRCDSLAELLEACEWWCDLFRTPEIAERIAYGAAARLHDDGVVYAEVSAGPRYWPHLPYPELLPALCAGFDRAAARRPRRLPAAADDQPRPARRVGARARRLDRRRRPPAHRRRRARRGRGGDRPHGSAVRARLRARPRATAWARRPTPASRPAPRACATPSTCSAPPHRPRRARDRGPGARRAPGPRRRDAERLPHAQRRPGPVPAASTSTRWAT